MIVRSIVLAFLMRKNGKEENPCKSAIYTNVIFILLNTGEIMINNKAVKSLLLLILIKGMIIMSVQETFSQTQDVKIAMCQIFCLDGDRSGNFVRIENAIIEAKEQGAEIICFPETAIFGWVNSDAHERAFSIPGEDSDWLCALAKKYNVYLCIGLAEKNGEHLHDSVILIDDGGNILLKHRKINILTELMTPQYTPGNEVNAVDTRYGKIGLLICADSFLDEYVNKMKELKPDLVLIPYGWAATEEKWPEHGKKLEKVVVKVAKTVNAPVIGTDLVGEISKGPWTGRVFGGQSVAVDKNGQIMALARDRDRDVKVFQVETGK